MLSKIGILLMGLFVAGGSFAAQPQELFSSNRDSVLSGDCYKIEGCYFGVGTAIVRTSQSASDNFAKEKAVQAAKSNLISRKSIENVSWPNAIDKTCVAVLSQLAARYISVQSSVSGIEVLSIEKTGANAYIAVVSVPEANLRNVPDTSFEEIRSLFLDPHWLKSNFKSHPQELYQFYLTQKKLPESLAGVGFDNWNELQLDLFCGIPHHIANTNAAPGSVETERRSTGDAFPQKDSEFIGNVNDTIGF